MPGMLHDIFISMDGETLNARGSRGQWHEQLTGYRDEFMEYISTRRSIASKPDLGHRALSAGFTARRRAHLRRQRP